MATALSDKNVFAFGTNYVLHSVPYSGQATTFSVDQSASSVAVVDPSGGPTATLGSASSGLKTVTLAAGGANIGGRVVVVTAHGTHVGSAKPQGN